MNKILKWFYSFYSYNLWNYKDGTSVLTKDYKLFGKKKQKVITDKEERHDIYMLTNVTMHDNCE